MIIKINPKELDISKLMYEAEKFENQNNGNKPYFFMNDETIKDLYSSINFTNFIEVENADNDKNGYTGYYPGYEIIRNNDLEYGEVEIKKESTK